MDNTESSPPWARRVSDAVFRAWLVRGLGRAPLYVAAHGGAHIRAAVLHACTHRLAYAWQLEGDRTDYLLRLVAAAGCETEARAEVLDRISGADDGPDAEQMLDVLLHWALAGDAECADAIRVRFQREAARGSSSGGDQLIRLDGVEGLRKVLATVGDGLREDAAGDADFWVWRIEEREGKEAAWRLLADAAQTDAGIARVIETVRLERAETKRARAASRPSAPTWPQLRDEIASRGRKTSYGILRRFARGADEAALRDAAAYLQATDDPDVQTPLLRIFGATPYPLDHSKLVGLCDSDDEQLKRNALLALELIEDAGLRSVAHTVLEGDPMWWYCGIGTLLRNYRSGDYDTVARTLARSQDDDMRHNVGVSVLEHLERTGDRPASLLLQLYEDTPCAMCRYSAARLLAETRQTPPWMVEEWRHDASAEMRELASRG